MGCCGSKSRRDDLEAILSEDDEPATIVHALLKPGELSGKGRLYACLGCLALSVLLSSGIYLLLLSFVTGRGEQDLLIINEESVNAFCLPGLTMANLPTHSWWPGCGAVRSLADFDGCERPCFEAVTIRRMQEFNAKYPGKLVTYSSRGNEFLKTVKLTGWWLPAPNISGSAKGEMPTRIVVQHSVGDNSNSFRMQLTAYMLRSLGFSVLLNNLRDHCYSEDSDAHLMGWGHSYPFDVLGAWDYARNDPDGELGGALPAGKVGMMGYSVGAYVTAIAFGLEKEVPAAWIDSSPFRPENVFLGRESFGVGPLTGTLLSQAWSMLKGRAEGRGVHIDQHLPEEVLPQGPDTQRHIGWVHNKQDSTVHFSDAEHLVELVEGLPRKYTVTKFVTEGSCHGEAHAVDNLRLFNEYAARLCSFWTDALGVSSSGCLGK